MTGPVTNDGPLWPRSLQSGCPVVLPSARWLALELDSRQCHGGTLRLLDRAGETIAVTVLSARYSRHYARIPSGAVQAVLDCRAGGYLRARPISAFRAVPAVCRMRLGEGRLWSRLRKAVGLVMRGDHAELRRRIVRQEVVPEAANIEIAPVPVPVAMPVRPPRVPLRAAVFSHSLALDGAPRSLLELTRGLTRSGFLAPVVFSMSGGPLVAAYRQAGIEVREAPFPAAELLDGASYETRLHDLVETFVGERFSVVVANTSRCFHAVHAAHMAGIPTLWTVREGEPPTAAFDWLPMHLQAEARRCLARANRIVFVAEATRAAWRPLLSGNDVLIRNAVDPNHLAQLSPDAGSDLRRRLGVPDERLLVLAVGTICARKGQTDLLRAFATLPAKIRSRAHLLVLGDIDREYRAQWRHALSHLRSDATANITILPAVSDVGAYYAAADIFVCCSRRESYPRTILEAKASALPIVTTLVDGIAEQVEADRTALVYEPGDGDRLAAHLGRLVSEEGLRARLAAAARTAADEEPGFDELLAAYRQQIEAITGMRDNA